MSAFLTARTRLIHALEGIGCRPDEVTRLVAFHQEQVDCGMSVEGWHRKFDGLTDEQAVELEAASQDMVTAREVSVETILEETADRKGRPMQIYTRSQGITAPSFRWVEGQEWGYRVFIDGVPHGRHSTDKASLDSHIAFLKGA